MSRCAQLEPDFVSVTYGAGGSTRGRTLELTKWIKQELGIEAMAHLSCVGATRDELSRDPRRASSTRGSRTCSRCGATRRAARPSWTPHPGGLRYSTELAALIASRYHDSASAAPASRRSIPRRADLASDLRFLKQKIDNGVSFLITQLFFDNELYFRFVDEARAAGIDVPIIPGIMPITDLAPDQDDHRDVRRDASPSRCSRRSSGASHDPRRGAPARRLLRDAAVRRAAGARRARASTSTRSTARPPRGRSCRRCGCCARGCAREVVRTARRSDLERVGDHAAARRPRSGCRPRRCACRSRSPRSPEPGPRPSFWRTSSRSNSSSPSETR